MSVAIIGGNECMIRRYAELCSDYGSLCLGKSRYTYKDCQITQ